MSAETPGAAGPQSALERRLLVRVAAWRGMADRAEREAQTAGVGAAHLCHLHRALAYRNAVADAEMAIRTAAEEERAALACGVTS